MLAFTYTHTLNRTHLGYQTLDPLDVREDTSVFYALEDEIKRAYACDSLLTPAHVMRDKSSLLEGIKSYGWPSAKDFAGRTFFELNLYGERRACADWYPITNQSLMFKRSFDPTHRDAAKFETSNIAEAKALVAQGFLVSVVLFDTSLDDTSVCSSN